MRIAEEINKRIKIAMRNSDVTRKSVLRYVKGKLDQMKPDLPDSETYKVIKGLLKESVEVPTMFSSGEIAELKDLCEWSISSGSVATPLTQEQVVDFLRETPDLIDRIRLASDDNRAMGLTMGALKGKSVEIQDVKSAIRTIRN